MTNIVEVQPVGMLFSQGREYFLLKPVPVVSDSWEGDNAYRWLVVPRSGEKQVDSVSFAYPHARHIVTNSFVVEYSGDMPPILTRKTDIVFELIVPSRIIVQCPGQCLFKTDEMRTAFVRIDGI